MVVSVLLQVFRLSELVYYIVWGRKRHCSNIRLFFCMPRLLVTYDFSFWRGSLLLQDWRYDDSAVAQVSTCVITQK